MKRAPGGGRQAALRGVAFALFAALFAQRAAAFDSKGHVVIEALAYRTLIQGYAGQPARPDVLRDLFNDGDLAPPLCFGWGDHPPEFCADATTTNPLLDWPKPLTDHPDAAFRRQFSDAGQCFHFMATLEDAESPDIEGTTIPRGLATSALVRCRDLLDNLMRQVVVDGGPGVRKGGYGLYELMHSVGDSFSGSHTQRRPETDQIEELRIWKPLTRMPGLANEKLARIPDSAFHKWDDHRDKTYVIEERVTADGRQCKDLTDYPYQVPFECLSEEGDHARQAIVELLIVVRDLRVAQEKAFATPTPSGVPVPEDPQQSDAWRSFKDHWFQGAYPCEGDECGVRQPTDISPGAYAFLGLDTTYNFTRKFVDVTGKATLFRYAWELNPFVYALSGEIGYRRYDDGDSTGLLGLEVDLALPIGRRLAVGFTPAAWRVAFGGDRTGSGDHDELLPHRLRHRQPFRPHDARSPGDRLAQARRRALPRNRRGLGPDARRSSPAGP